jgi:hypothetical protein
MAFDALIVAHKSCRVCIERSPGRIRSCAEFPFAPDVVSLWEQWLGHRRPKLLVVGQDFGNVGYFIRNRRARRAIQQDKRQLASAAE